MRKIINWSRLLAVIIKEFIQIKRDKGTLAMIIIIPLLQVILFGYAINSDPKHLPTAVLQADNSIFTRDILAALQTSQYFDITRNVNSEKEADEAMRNGKDYFIINIPTNFSRDLVHGLQPKILLQADAIDSGAISSAIATMQQIIPTVLNRDLQGPLNYLVPTPAPFNIEVQQMYNPNMITQYNIVPGLIGVVITLTMVMITCSAITRERERGTMESLLSTPVLPSEVMIGKILPYIIIGYIQLALILIIGKILFAIPIIGSISLLLLAAAPFIAANLAVGLLMSTIARNQLQSVQMTVFFFLPSILLTGFMFPFPGMPRWAQMIGEVLPLTHFLRITRGILVKGNNFMQVIPEFWPILLFFSALILLSIKRFQRTLD